MPATFSERRRGALVFYLHRLQQMWRRYLIFRSPCRRGILFLRAQKKGSRVAVTTTPGYMI